jgi:hypothetical protein
MGNSACCSGDDKEKANTATAAELDQHEAMPVLSDSAVGKGGGAGKASKGKPGTYSVTLNKSGGEKLGLDVDYMEGRAVLPIMAITGGLAEKWNNANPDKQMCKGDSVVEVNGVSANVVQMLEKCKSDKILELTLRKALTYDNLIVDLEKLISTKRCGALLLLLACHDAGAYCEGRKGAMCPNAIMRFLGAGEGLPADALGMMTAMTEKYVPDLISSADLWALAGNTAIRMMGGPDVPTRFGRPDVKSKDVVEVKRADSTSAAQIREIFSYGGFDDKAIVALCGIHTVGECQKANSGFDGKWTEENNKFDNAYFKDLLTKAYASQGTHHRHAASGTIMLNSDLLLVQEAAFKKHVERFAESQDIFFALFAESWSKLQELGHGNLRDIL